MSSPLVSDAETGPDDAGGASDGAALAGDPSALACETCETGLREFDRTVRCPNCGAAWPIDEGGVVRFADGGAADVSDELAALRDRLGSVGYARLFKHASKFEGDLREYHPDFDYSEWLDPARADWTLVGDPLDGDVLDLGGGYGATARTLATHGANVTLVGRSLDALRFASFAARLLDVDGVRPVHANVLDPPLRPESFDAVVLNRVWKVAGATDARVRLLDRVRSLLRPGGTLYLKVPNRRDPRRAVGTVAGHLTSGANRVAESALPTEPPANDRDAYTRSECAAMLRRAGFESVEVRYAFPDAEVPQFVFADERAFGDIVGRKLATAAADRIPGLSLSTAHGLRNRLPTAGLSRFAPAFVLEARR